MTGSTTVSIRVRLPRTGESNEDYVQAALRRVARTYLEHGQDSEVAGCYGNWDSEVLHSPEPYQPTLWEN